MSKPIWFIELTVKYNKDSYTFTLPAIADTIDEFTEFDKKTVVQNVYSHKGIGEKYKEVFEKCSIINFKKIKQIGSTSKF